MRSKSMISSKTLSLIFALICAEFAGEGLAAQKQNQAQNQKSRRSQRVVPFQKIAVSSPDGKITFHILPNAERMTYSVSLENTPVIESSPLMISVDGNDLTSGVVIQKVEREEIKDTYPWLGAHNTATNHCNSARIAIIHDLTMIQHALEVRVFNDGVAYRHNISGEPNISRVPDERTAFVLPTGSQVWYAGLDGHYEAAYEDKDIAKVLPGEWAAPPLTFKLPGGAGYGSITEANLVNYGGMALEADGRGGWIVGLGHRQPLNYPFELRYGRDEGKRLAVPASIKGPITTPWRCILIGRNLNTLVNSTLLPNLCPPPDPTLFPQGFQSDWIKPGRAVWRYLDGGPSGVNGMKEFSRLAGQLGFEHHVIEGFWSRWTMEERQEVVNFSNKQGVKLWFWKHSNQLRTPEDQEEFFKMLHILGVAGAKIDFFDHEAKEIIDLYEQLLRKAAEYHILVVFHGANKPTGRLRTWPNELVREAVRGMESSRFNERARHETILPFTRYLAGPTDYTTMIFGERRRDTTWAHQVASMAIFSSPLLTIAANPQSILDNPAVDMIKSIPAVWDETIVLPESEIGRLAAYALRSGKTWFLAVMNGPKAGNLITPLTFLGTGSFNTLLVCDNPNNGAAVEVQTKTMNPQDTLTIEMPAGGGFIARFNVK